MNNSDWNDSGKHLIPPPLISMCNNEANNASDLRNNDDKLMAALMSRYDIDSLSDSSSDNNDNSMLALMSRDDTDSSSDSSSDKNDDSIPSTLISGDYTNSDDSNDNKSNQKPNKVGNSYEADNKKSNNGGWYTIPTSFAVPTNIIFPPTQ